MREGAPTGTVAVRCAVGERSPPGNGGGDAMSGGELSFRLEVQPNRPVSNCISVAF